VTTLFLLILLATPSAAPSAKQTAERCQIVVSALVGDEGILNSEECVRRVATEGARILIDPVLKHRGSPDSPFLPAGTDCDSRFLVVRREEMALASEKAIGVLVLELTRRRIDAFDFDGYLEVLGPRLSYTGSIGCGAVRRGALTKKDADWSVSKASEWRYSRPNLSLKGPALRRPSSRARSKTRAK